MKKAARKRRPSPLKPCAGDWRGPDGNVQVGVMLMRGGRWRGHEGWVGGEQVALVTWRRGYPGKQEELYRRVERVLVACGRATTRCLMKLELDGDVEVHHPERAT